MSRWTTALVAPKLDGRFKFQEVYLDSLKPNEALVEIHATGLCHTDIAAANGWLSCNEPNAVFGHEGAGVIIETGAEVTGLEKGDKVVLSFSHCESCEECTSGHPSYCHSFFPRNMGGRRPDGTPSTFTKDDKGTGMFSSFFGQSSFSSVAVVHRSCIVKMPAEWAANLYLYAPLGCGVQTGAGAVLNVLDVQPGSTLAVFGVGAVGLAAVMAGKLRKAKTIIAVDLVPGRLEVAARLGATHTVVGGTDHDAVLAQVQGICSPQYAVDCSGVPAVIETMLKVLKPRGRAVTIGAAGAEASVNINIIQHIVSGKEYVGCCEGDSNPAKFLPYLMEMHANGSFPLEELVTFYDFKDYEKAMDDTKTGKTIKAVMRWK